MNSTDIKRLETYFYGLSTYEKDLLWMHAELGARLIIPLQHKPSSQRTFDEQQVLDIIGRIISEAPPLRHEAIVYRGIAVPSSKSIFQTNRHFTSATTYKHIALGYLEGNSWDQDDFLSGTPACCLLEIILPIGSQITIIPTNPETPHLMAEILLGADATFKQLSSRVDASILYENIKTFNMTPSQLVESQRELGGGRIRSESEQVIVRTLRYETTKRTNRVNRTKRVSNARPDHADYSDFLEQTIKALVQEYNDGDIDDLYEIDRRRILRDLKYAFLLHPSVKYDTMTNAQQMMTQYIKDLVNHRLQTERVTQGTRHRVMEFLIKNWP